MPEQVGGAESGAVVRTARREAGLTLRALAVEVGVSTGTMSAIENGKVGLTVARLGRIAEALGVPPSRLLDPPRPEVAREADRGSAAQSGSPDSAWREFGGVELDPVLASAVEVFHDTGYHGATMRLIAAGADISVAGIYHHYPSKKHLLVELIRRAHDELHWRLEAAAAEGADPAEEFANMVEALVLFREKRRSLAFVMVTEASRVDDLLEPAQGPGHSGIEVAFERVAWDAIRTGHFGIPEPHLAVGAILTMCLAPSTWPTSSSGVDSSDLARSYSELALAMMKDRRHQ